MKEQLSSGMTGFYRYMFTGIPILVAAGVVGTAVAARVPIVLVALPFLALIGWFIGRSMWSATQVIADDRGVVVGSETQSIPYSEIESVTQWLWNPELVTIRLRSGRTIRFFPPWRVRLGLSKNPIVETLRTRAALR